MKARSIKEKEASSSIREHLLNGEIPFSDSLETENILSHLADVFFSGNPVNGQSSQTADDQNLPSLTDVYRILVEQIPAIVFITFFDEDYGEAYVSPQIETTLGFTSEEWLHSPALWYQQIHPADRERVVEQASRTLFTGDPLQTEFRALAQDGRTLWFHCEAKLVKTADNRPMFIHGVGFDITKWQRDEAALRQYAERMKILSRRLIDVQEAERRRIALELHDEFGQILTGLKLTLEMCARSPENEARAGIAGAHALVNELINRTRQLSLDLRPATLDHLGLLPALLRHFRLYTTQTKVEVDFDHANLEGKRFAPELETAAFRIVQEALTNVARHSGAEQAMVRIWADRKNLTVQIEDHGKGFDADAEFADAHSNGLTGMRERALMLGGHFSVESRPGETHLTAKWKLEE